MKRKDRDRSGFIVFQQLGAASKEALRDEGLLAPAPKAKEQDLRSDEDRTLAQYRWEKRHPHADTHSKNWARRRKTTLRWFKREVKFRLIMLIRDAERKQAAKQVKVKTKRRKLHGKAPMSRQGIRVLA